MRTRRCECGCGGWTAGGRFLPGHDAILKSRLLRAVANGDQAAYEELERRNWLGQDTRKFGVEIEFFGCTPQTLIDAMAAQGLRCRFEGYSHEVMSEWKIVTDGSVNGSDTGEGTGLELVSPPLKGKDGFEQLKKACKALSSVGARVDSSCGLHVHHDCNDLKLSHIKNMVTIYRDNQYIIDGFLPTSRRSSNYHRYCSPISSHEYELIQDMTSLSQLSQINRYRVINVKSYGKYGTIEIRQHSGTIEYAKIASWVMLGKAIVKAAKSGKSIRANNHMELLTALKMTKADVDYFIGRHNKFARRAA